METLRLLRTVGNCKGLGIAVDHGRRPTAAERRVKGKVVITTTKASPLELPLRVDQDLGFLPNPFSKKPPSIKGPLLRDANLRVDHVMLSHCSLDSTRCREADVWQAIERAWERFRVFEETFFDPFVPYVGGLVCLEIAAKTIRSRPCVLVHLHLLGELETEDPDWQRSGHRKQAFRWSWESSATAAELKSIRLIELGQEPSDMQNMLQYLFGACAVRSRVHGSIRIAKLIAPYAGRGDPMNDDQLRLVLAGHAWPKPQRRWLYAWKASTWQFRSRYRKRADALRRQVRARCRKRADALRDSGGVSP